MEIYDLGIKYNLTILGAGQLQSKIDRTLEMDVAPSFGVSFENRANSESYQNFRSDAVLQISEISFKSKILITKLFRDPVNFLAYKSSVYDLIVQIMG